MSESLAHRLRVIAFLLAAQFALLIWYGAGGDAPSSIAALLEGSTSTEFMYAVSAVAICWVVGRWLRDWPVVLPGLPFRPRPEAGDRPAAGEVASEADRSVSAPPVRVRRGQQYSRSD